MCSYLASFPAALAHAFIARYSRPGDVVLDPFSGRGTAPSRPLAEGRIGVGNDLNPFAQVLTAAKVEPAAARRGARPASPPSASPGPRRRPRASGSWPVPPTRRPSCPGGSGGGRRAPRPSPTRSRSRSTRGPSASCCSCATQLDLERRVDRFLAGALAGILHGKTPSYLSTLMPNTFSMAPRYVRDFVAGRLRAARAGRVRRPGGEARPALPPAAPPAPRASRCSATRGRRPRARLALRRAASPTARPARRDLPALPAGPQVRLLQLAPRVAARVRRPRHRRQLDDAHRREPYLEFLREVLADLRPGAHRRRHRGPRDRRRRDGPRQAVDAGHALAERCGRRPPRPRATAWPGSRRRDPRPPQDDPLWGDEAGRATKVDRILVLGATEAGRRRALAGRSLPLDWTWPPTRLRAESDPGFRGAHPTGRAAGYDSSP